MICVVCLVPYGVFIGCHDLDVCKKFAASACMVHWVRETCKTKCGSCGYGKNKICQPEYYSSSAMRLKEMLIEMP